MRILTKRTNRIAHTLVGDEVGDGLGVIVGDAVDTCVGEGVGASVGKGVDVCVGGLTSGMSLSPARVRTIRRFLPRLSEVRKVAC